MRQRNVLVVLRLLASVAVIMGVLWIVALLGAEPEGYSPELPPEARAPEPARIVAPLEEPPREPEPEPAAATPAPPPPTLPAEETVAPSVEPTPTPTPPVPAAPPAQEPAPAAGPAPAEATPAPETVPEEETKRNESGGGLLDLFP